MSLIINILFFLISLSICPLSTEATQEAAAIVQADEIQQAEWAVVDISLCFLRLKPDYESSNETQCLMGTVLKVKDSDRYWRQVDAPDYKGCWTTELGLAFMTEAQKDAYIAAPKYICTAEYTHIYLHPDTNGERLCDFIMGDIVRKASSASTSSNDVYGWERVLTASGKEAWVLQKDVEDFAKWAQTKKAKLSRLLPDEIVDFAEKFKGVPYLWGGNSIKHFDCSGFTKFVYMMNGIILPRNAREQINTGSAVPYDFEKMQPGDLIFYGRKAEGSKPMLVTHVAMYIGDAHIIHSSQLVRINSLRKSDSDYYEREVLGVRRILGNVDCSKGIISVSRSPWYFKQ